MTENRQRRVQVDSRGSLSGVTQRDTPQTLGLNEATIYAILPAVQSAAKSVFGTKNPVENWDDATQNVFIRWLQKDRGVEDPVSYARRAGVNAAFDVFKKEQRRKSTPATDYELEQLSPTVPSPEDAVTGNETRTEAERAVHAAIDQLAPGQRDVIWLVYFQEVPPTEAAERLGVTLGTIKSQLSRGLAALRKNQNLVGQERDAV